MYFFLYFSLLPLCSCTSAFSTEVDNGIPELHGWCLHVFFTSEMPRLPKYVHHYTQTKLRLVNHRAGSGLSSELLALPKARLCQYHHRQAIRANAFGLAIGPPA